MVGQLLVAVHRMTFAQRPAAFAPFVALGGGHFLRQIHALQPGKTPRQFQRLGFIGLTQRLTRQQASTLGTLVTQNARQTTGIDIGDTDNIARLEVVRQALLTAEAARQQRQVANHQTCRPDFCGLFVFAVNAGITNMGIGQGHDLTSVGGVGQDLLIAGHGGIENHFTNRMPVRTDGNTPKNTAVFKGEYG